MHEMHLVLADSDPVAAEAAQFLLCRPPIELLGPVAERPVQPVPVGALRPRSGCYCMCSVSLSARHSWSEIFGRETLAVILAVWNHDGRSWPAAHVTPVEDGAGLSPGHLAASHITRSITAHRAGRAQAGAPWGDRKSHAQRLMPGRRGDSPACRTLLLISRAFGASSAVWLVCLCPLSAGACRYQLARTSVPFPARWDWPI